MEAKGLIEEIKVIQKDVDYRKLKITNGNQPEYDFSDYKTFKKLFRDLYYKKISIDDAKRKQEEFSAVIYVLEKYIPKKINLLKQKISSWLT